MGWGPELTDHHGSGERPGVSFARSRRGEARRVPISAPRRVEADGLGLALEGDRGPFLPAFTLTRYSLERGLGDKHIVARLARGRLDARGGVDRVADHGEVESSTAADGAREHASRVHADADPQCASEALVHELRDLERDGYGSVGVVWMPLGRAEHRQHAIADELVRVPAAALDHGNAYVVERIEPSDDLLGARSLGHRREVAHVEEEHRGLDDVAREVGALIEHALGEARVHEGAEGVPQALALAEADGHGVERAGERSRL